MPILPGDSGKGFIANFCTGVGAARQEKKGPTLLLRLTGRAAAVLNEGTAAAERLMPAVICCRAAMCCWAVIRCRQAR